jgi:hypothetical protein
VLFNGTDYPISELTLSPSQIGVWDANVLLRSPTLKSGRRAIGGVLCHASMIVIRTA